MSVDLAGDLGTSYDVCDKFQSLSWLIGVRLVPADNPSSCDVDVGGCAATAAKSDEGCEERAWRRCVV